MLTKQRQQFPFNLDSNKNIEPSQPQQTTFQNYYPKSQKLQQQSYIIKANNQSAQIVRQTQKKMKEMNVQSLVASGKINIYPKKNTIDLKKHLEKKMMKIEKKTEKAIMHIAREIIKEKAKKEQDNK